MPSSQPQQVRHVAIVGAGFSGALQAINLVRHDGPRATLIERRRTDAGRGVAYAAADPGHLLNVRAGNMSALPDQPDHFARWLAEHHPEGSGFAPRLVYGDYLEALLAATREAHQGRVALVDGDAVDLVVGPEGVRVVLADGRAIAADAAVLAVGNLPPHEPPALAGAGLDADRYAPDPWAADVARGLAPGDTVLAIGSGLTMIDVALLLEKGGHPARMIALSRRGLFPRAHGPAENAAPITERPPLGATDLLRATRGRARAVGWRAAVDELRPFTQGLWQASGEEARRRFLRHLRPWWDVHRHRLAPDVAARVAAMMDAGRLEVAAGKLVAVERVDGGVRVAWRPRGADAVRTELVRRVVNCSGPQGDLARTSEPLLRRLREAGCIRPDPLHLGIDATAQSEVVGADGRPNPRLLAIGPLTRGRFWEIVAVPDIRVQTWAVARRLANAHWVGGEGL